MTPQEAAKACMARVYGPLRNWLTPSALADTERAFTEIISQVVATGGYRKITEWEHEALRSTIAEAQLAAARQAAASQGFPQEIVEPQPRYWWQRWFR